MRSFPTHFAWLACLTCDAFEKAPMKTARSLRVQQAYTCHLRWYSSKTSYIEDARKRAKDKLINLDIPLLSKLRSLLDVALFHILGPRKFKRKIAKTSLKMLFGVLSRNVVSFFMVTKFLKVYDRYRAQRRRRGCETKNWGLHNFGDADGCFKDEAIKESS